MRFTILTMERAALNMILNDKYRFITISITDLYKAFYNCTYKI